MIVLSVFIIIIDNCIRISLQSWIIQGGQPGQHCGALDAEQALVFEGPAKSRQLCTPYLNLRSAGSVNFELKTGSESLYLEVLLNPPQVFG